jgi:hypothetical protein
VAIDIFKPIGSVKAMISWYRLISSFKSVEHAHESGHSDGGSSTWFYPEVAAEPAWWSSQSNGSLSGGMGEPCRFTIRPFSLNIIPCRDRAH